MGCMKAVQCIDGISRHGKKHIHDGRHRQNVRPFVRSNASDPDSRRVKVHDNFIKVNDSFIDNIETAWLRPIVSTNKHKIETNKMHNRDPFVRGVHESNNTIF